MDNVLYRVAGAMNIVAFIPIYFLVGVPFLSNLSFILLFSGLLLIFLKKEHQNSLFKSSSILAIVAFCIVIIGAIWAYLNPDENFGAAFLLFLLAPGIIVISMILFFAGLYILSKVIRKAN